MGTIISVYTRQRLTGDRMTGEWNPLSDADIARFLVRSFEHAVDSPSAETMAVLRNATIAVAAALRRTALAPERAVVMLKDILRGHGGAGWAPSIAAERGLVPACLESRIYGALFTWWVTAYYAEYPFDASNPLVDRPAAPA